MRYYIDKPKHYGYEHGEIYVCNHPAYSMCTLFKQEDIGLAVIQQKFDPILKRSWWANIEPWLTDLIFEQKGFQDYFAKMAGPMKENGAYPTVTVRQIMWALRMKPLKKEPWETVFDHSPI